MMNPFNMGENMQVLPEQTYINDAMDSWDAPNYDNYFNDTRCPAQKTNE